MSDASKTESVEGTKKYTKDEILQMIKEDLTVDNIKDLIKDLLNIKELEDKVQEVFDSVESSNLYQKYSNLSKSKQKYLLAGISLVVGIVIGYFI